MVVGSPGAYELLNHGPLTNFRVPGLNSFCGSGLRSSWLHHDFHTIFLPVDTPCPTGQCCSMQCSPVGNIIGDLFPITACVIPSGTKKVSQQGEIFISVPIWWLCVQLLKQFLYYIRVVSSSYSRQQEEPQWWHCLGASVISLTNNL